MNLLPGPSDFRAELKGYSPIQKSVTVDHSDAVVDLTMEPLPPPLILAGTLELQTAPAAQVYVDDKFRSSTDQKGKLKLELDSGTHKIRVEKVGYQTPRSQEVVINAGSTRALKFNLVLLTASDTNKPLASENNGKPALTPPVEIPAAKAIPPPPPIVDCSAPDYGGVRRGTLKWFNGKIEPDGIVVTAGPDQDLAGGNLGGKHLPGCEVTVRPLTSGIKIEEAPAREDGYRRIKLRNISKTPISHLEIQWDLK
jgi:hypothetical protein